MTRHYLSRVLGPIRIATLPALLHTCFHTTTLHTPYAARFVTWTRRFLRWATGGLVDVKKATNDDTSLDFHICSGVDTSLLSSFTNSYTSLFFLSSCSAYLLPLPFSSSRVHTSHLLPRRCIALAYTPFKRHLHLCWVRRRTTPFFVLNGRQLYTRMLNFYCRISHFFTSRTGTGRVHCRICLWLHHHTSLTTCTSHCAVSLLLSHRASDIAQTPRAAAIWPHRLS